MDRLMNLSPFGKNLVTLLVWLPVLMLIYIELGWSSWFSSCRVAFCANDLAAILFLLSVAAAYGCRMLGFRVWEGLFSLTVGSLLILTVASTAIERVDWAIAIALIWISIFAMDIALSKAVNNLLDAELRKSQVFQVLLSICAIGIFIGTMLPFIFPFLATYDLNLFNL